MKQFLVIACLIGLASILVRGQEGTNSVEATYQNANTALREKRYADAISLYTQVIQQNPRYVNAFERRTAAYLKLDQYRLAMVDATSAIQLASTNPGVYALRGAAHQGLNEFDQAIADFSKTLTLLDDQATSMAGIRAEILVNRAKALLGKSDYTNTIADCNSALATSPDYLPATETKALALTGLTNYRAAIEAYSSALRKDSKRSDLYELRASVYVLAGDNTNAARDFESSWNSENPIPLRQGRIPVRMLRANAWLVSRDYKRAISDYSSVIAIAPTNVEASFYRGTAYVSLKNYTEAILDFRNVIRHAPALSVAYFELGNCLSYLGQVSEAITNYSSVVRLDPRNGSAFSSRGLLHAQRGEFETGLADCEKGVELYPESAHCLNNLAWLLSVLPSGQLRDGKRALNLAQKACKLADWEHPYYLGTLAAAYAENGDFRLAVEFQKKSLKTGFPEAKEANQCLRFYEQGKPFRLTPSK